MRTILANPIYDAAFKFLMDDQMVARHLLSALLKKEVVNVEMSNREFVSKDRTKIPKMHRLDFTAKVLNKDGTTEKVIIEMQKTGAEPNLMRFRRYLGLQYLQNDTFGKVEESEITYKVPYNYPIVSVYILGHLLNDLQKPIIYVRRKYLDYNDNELVGKDRFIENLTHDSIIVQIPLLPEKATTGLEKMLHYFNQNYCTDTNPRLLEFDINEDELLENKACGAIVNRLQKAAVSPDVYEQMEMEEEILFDLERRDTVILKQKGELEKKDLQIKKNKSQLKKSKLQLKEKDSQLHEQHLQLQEKDQSIISAIKSLYDMNIEVGRIAEMVSVSEEVVKRCIMMSGEQ